VLIQASRTSQQQKLP